MKHIIIVRYVLMSISLLTIVLYFAGLADLDVMLNWGYIMVALTVASVIILPAYTLIQNPKGALSSLIGLGILAVILGVCWALASDTPVVTPANTYSDAFALKFSDTGLFATYIALGATILTIIVTEVSNIFK